MEAELIFVAVGCVSQRVKQGEKTDDQKTEKTEKHGGEQLSGRLQKSQLVRE